MFFKPAFMYFLFSVLIAMMGCGGGGGGDAPGVGGRTPATSQNIFYTNPTDNKVFTIVDDVDGSKFTYLGEIDDRGDLFKLNIVMINRPEIDGDLVYILDDNGMPKTIHTPESTFEIEPISDSSIRLTATSKTGELRVSIPLELAADSQIATYSNNENYYSYRSLNSGHSSKANMHVTLTKCGQPVENALISVLIDPPIGTMDPIGTHIGNGEYAFFIPSSNLEQRVKRCDGIAQGIRRYCQYSGFILPFFNEDTTCESLEQTVAHIPFVSSSIKQQITRYCRPSLIELLPRITAKICDGSDIAEEIERACKWQAIMNEPSGPHTFTLSVNIPGSEPYTTQPVSFSPNQPQPWSTQAPTTIDLEKFYIVPASPKNTEWYDAYASMVCPDPDHGTLVTLSVRGSDGLEKSTEKNMTTNSTISLDIPGVQDPSQSVTDTITVEAEGKTWTMAVHRKAGETEEAPEEEQKKYHVFKVSGVGYRGNWGGFADKFTGYHYSYQYIFPSEVDRILDPSRKDAMNDFKCQHLPTTGPYHHFPDIWQTRDVTLETASVFASDMDPYRCDTHRNDPSSVICNRWDKDTKQRVDGQNPYWDAINSICGR